MEEKRGQASVEYVMIVGFALMMLIPIVLIYTSEREGMESNFNLMQAGNIARKIVDAAEKVYFMGKPAQTLLKINMPDNVESITITNNGVYFFVRANDKLIEVSYESEVNMTGSIPAGAGLMDIIVKAEEGYVNITKR